MKKKILNIIYTEFEQWTSNQNFCCSKGCAVCCTQNVTITAFEGMAILKYCIDQGQIAWFANKLCCPNEPTAPSITTNEYIAACLKEKNFSSGIMLPMSFLISSGNTNCGL